MEQFKNKTTQRIVSVFLVALMIFSMIPVNAFAENVDETTTETTTQQSTTVEESTTAESTTAQETTTTPESTTAESTTAESTTAESTTAQETTTQAESTTVTETTTKPGEDPTTNPEEPTTQAPTSYRVTVYKNDGGKVTLNDVDATTLTVNINEAVHVLIVPEEGYYISKINGETPDDITKYDVTVNSETEIDVEFAKYTYEVEVIVGENGELKHDGVKVEGNITVEYGNAPEFLIAAKDGYAVSLIKYNDEIIALDDESIRETVDDVIYSLPPVTSNVKIEVDFEENEIVEISNITDNEYYSVSFTKDPVKTKAINGINTVILPAGATAIFKPQGKYKYISVNDSDLKKEIDFTGRLNKIKVKVTSLKNNLRYKDFNIKDISIVVDDKVNPAEITLPSDTIYYSSDIEDIKIAVPKDELSGIADVIYALTVDDTIVEGKSLIRTENNPLVLNSETGMYETTVDVDAELVDQKENVKLKVLVKDKAGNNSEITEQPIVVNTTAPDVTVSIDGAVSEFATLSNHYKGEKQGDVVRTATITIADWDETFDADKATGCLKVNAYKSSEDETDITDGNFEAPVISGWAKTGENTYTCTVKFIGDAYYKWSFDEYVNKAGMSDAEVVEKTADNKAENMYSFTCDTTTPDAKFNVGSKLEELWNNTFGVFKNTDLTVSVEDVTDNLSEPCDVLYYKLEDASVTSALTKEALDNLYKENKFVAEEYSFSKENPDAFVVYARITDGAGNVKYISSDGIIIDTTAVGIDAVITTECTNSYNYYNDDVIITINSVEEAAEYKNSTKGDLKIYSGINSVDYIIKGTDANGESISESGNLYKFNIENPKYADLVTILNKDNKDFTNTIKVNAETFNCDNVVVEITAFDNADNPAETKVFEFNINSTEPVIGVEFEDDDKPVSVIDGRGYYSDSRTATVTVLDRATTFIQADENNENYGLIFDVRTVDGTKVTKIEEGAEAPAGLGETYSVVRSGQEATITFNGNANYIWSVSYTNKADVTVTTGEDNLNAVIGDTPFNFTVDKSKPSGTITVAEKTWDKILEIITFGLYTNDKFTVTATAKDSISPYDVEYYKTYEPSVIVPEKITEWDAFDSWDNEKGGSFDVNDKEKDKNEQFVVYLKITDAAGNVEYINSDGAIVDRTAPAIKLSVEPAADNDKDEEYNIYNEDVEVNISVSDIFDTYVNKDGEEVGFNYSGIKSVDYWVGYDLNNDGDIFDDEKTQPTKNLFTYEFVKTESGREYPVQSELEDVFETSILVSSAANNVCNAVVTVIATDNAGNPWSESVVLDIDITKPLVNVEYDNNAARNEKYFAAERTATVTVNERSHHFHTTKVYLNLEAADTITDGIIITAVNAKGENVNATLINDNGIIKVADLTEGTAVTEMTISEDAWTTIDEGAPDEATHSTKIKFEADANYTLDVKYIDKAANEFEGDITSNSVAPLEFTVDKTAPTGTVIAAGKSAVDGKEIEPKVAEWDEIIKDFTFGFWSNKSITITNTANDVISPIENVYYYKTTGDDVYDYKTVNSPAEIKDVESAEIIWTELGEGFTVLPDEHFVAYLKIVDKAGNTAYVSTDGLTVDDKAPIEEVVAPEVTVTPEQPINGIYNDDVTVDVKVVDPIYNSSFSGLKSIDYKVYNMGQVTQEGNLYTFDKVNPTKKDLLREWAEKDIVVDSKLNNSNDVKIEIIAWDNAMNSSRKSVDIKIDITAPEITLSYDNNSADSGTYYKANRTATIVVKERNFSVEDVITKITNTDGVIPTLSAWTTKAGTGNGDDTTHTATVIYEADGDYEFSIACTDLAGNKMLDSGLKIVTGTTNPFAFTIDKTLPVISVSYDNNSAQNDKYFNANRTATVVVTEHNFDVSRVNITITAALDESSISVPGVSWVSSGDVHTATIDYSYDGDFTFAIDMTDMAGNANNGVDYGSTVAGEEFTIDTTIDTPVISVVENGKSYKGAIIPSVSFSDINYMDYSITLYRTRTFEKNLDVTDKYIAGVSESSTGISGSFDTFDVKKQENDGLYTLTVECSDLAGNTASQTVTFTLNRFGSVYTLSEYLISLKEAYVQKVEQKLVITEYNADRLVENSLKVFITRDGSLVDDVKFTVNPVANNTVAIGESGWYQYDYIIDTSNFDKDGVYKITVSSEDEVGNKPESLNYDDCEILFRVDTTAPEFTSIIGLEKAIVNADSKTIDFEVFDAIGLKSLTIYVNGQIVKVFDSFEDLINFKGSEVIGEGSNQKVRLVAEDLAGNKTDTDAVDEDGEYVFNPEYDFERDLTVSTNFFVRWYANKPLFFGSIAGALGVVAAIIIIVAKKRKKDEE